MATKCFDPRKLMELAVDVMVKSTLEPRGDGKASPLVGAEYKKAMAIPNRTAKFHLKRMTDLGLLRIVGAGRATRYEVMR